ncbi:MAG: glycosyltransferase family 2 protein [Gemmatimonadetes bacterium]|nr:glycosyltransferase family 2 protein [Gemmatimonadota bacterium]
MSEPLLAPENDYGSLLGREIPAPSLHLAVVIPVYNRVALLERTLAGIRAQTYPSSLISVVIADDGSEVIEVVEADTSVVALPFSSDYRIVEREAQYNFYVRAAAPDSQSVVVRMQVLVDDEEWYDQERDLAEQPHDFLFLR